LKNKKILLVGRASLSLGGKATGGISKHIDDLSIKLTENNFEVIIWDFTLKKSYSKSTVRIEGLNYTDIILGLIYSIFCLNIIFNKSYQYLSLKDKFLISTQSLKLKNYIIEKDINLVHVHSLNRPITHFLRLKFSDLKIFITDHGFWQKKGLVLSDNNSILKKINKNIELATGIITISSFANAQFKIYKLPTHKNINIPNPIFLSKIPIKETCKENIIFFNGFNSSLERKNFELVIKALKHLSFFENYKLVAIVNNEAKTFIKSIGVNFQIEILGAQPWEVVVDLYNKSKILVVPSKSESFGLVYLESLSVGTPIVGFHETVKEFQNKIDLDIGETFNSELENYKDLANKIESVLTRKYDKHQIRKKIQSKYDWDFSIKKYINLYNCL
jgi:glycosyltransferase involved in cell wall biosynthesis